MLRPQMKSQATVLAGVAALRAVQMPTGQLENERKRAKQKQKNNPLLKSF